MFSAHYLPKLYSGQSDPSRTGFATESEAWEFVFASMCNGCQEKRNNFLSGVPEDHFTSDEWPACTCEWMVDDEPLLEGREHGSEKDIQRA